MMKARASLEKRFICNKRASETRSALIAGSHKPNHSILRQFTQLFILNGASKSIEEGGQGAFGRARSTGSGKTGE
ncbi:hypothetical protein EON65_34210 [archaeon]|nr:MAG: hypothetical protein EON65_34210 [archaeon]